MEEFEQTQGAGPRFGHSGILTITCFLLNINQFKAILCNDTLFVLFGVNQKGLITNDVYFLSLSGSATWLKSYSMITSDNNKVSGTLLSNSAVIGITIGSVLLVSVTSKKIIHITKIGF